MTCSCGQPNGFAAPFTRHVLSINLKDTNSYTDAIDTGCYTEAIIQGVLRASQVWSTAVVSMQWTITDAIDDQGNALASWTAFSPAVTLSTSTSSRPVVSIPRNVKIRFATTTAAATADSAMRLVVILQ